MTGDQNDVVNRLTRVLPRQWFSSVPGATPILTAVLNGCAAVGAWFYALIAYVGKQMRIETSTDGWLELAALDYLGEGNFPRLNGETDSEYSARIIANILPHADTRAAVSSAVEKVSGEAPRITEPWQPTDTGIWDGVQQSLYRYDEGLSFDQIGLDWDEGLTTVGAMYWDVDTRATPFRFTAEEPFTAFIESVIPSVTGGNLLAFWDTNFFWDAPGSSLMDVSGIPSGEQDVINAILNTKVEGVAVAVRFYQPTAPALLSDAAFWGVEEPV